MANANEPQSLFLRELPPDLLARIDRYAEKAARPGSRKSRPAAAVALIERALKEVERAK